MRSHLRFFHPAPFTALLIIILSLFASPMQAGAPDRDNNGLVNIQDLLNLLEFKAPIPVLPGDLFQYVAVWQNSAGFNFKDYFPLTANSTWHYIGFNGGSSEDNFRWTVETAMQDLGDGKQASRMRTNTDEPTDDRNLDVDFWHANAQGQVFFYGVHIGTAKNYGVFSLPVQDIVLADPVMIGRDGLKPGDQVTDTGSGQIKITPSLWPFLTSSFNATTTYVGFIPSFVTPLGTFTNVLKIVIDIEGTVVIPYGGSKSFSLKNNTFFLKEGVGMIAQDQSPDPNDAELQGIDSGTVYVGGSPVPVTAH